MLHTIQFKSLHLLLSYASIYCVTHTAVHQFESPKNVTHFLQKQQQGNSIQLELNVLILNCVYCIRFGNDKKRFEASSIAVACTASFDGIINAAVILITRS